MSKALTTYAGTSNTIVDAADGCGHMLEHRVYRLLDSYVDPESLGAEVQVGRHFLGLDSGTFCSLEIQVGDDDDGCVGPRKCQRGGSTDTTS